MIQGHTRSLAGVGQGEPIQNGELEQLIHELSNPTDPEIETRGEYLVLHASVHKKGSMAVQVTVPWRSDGRDDPVADIYFELKGQRAYMYVYPQAGKHLTCMQNPMCTIQLAEAGGG